MSLAVNQLIGFGARQPAAGGGAATISFISRLDSATTVSAISYEHTSVSLGSSAYLLVALAGLATSSTVASVTVGDGTNTPISATIVSNGTATNFGVMGMIANPNPGGTSSIILTRTGGTLTRYSGALFAVTNISSTTNHANANTTTWTANVGSLSFNVPAGGIAAAVAYNTSTSSSTFTWTGLTETSDALLHSNRTTTSAADAFASAQTPLSVTATSSGAASGCLIGASWSN